MPNCPGPTHGLDWNTDKSDKAPSDKLSDGAVFYATVATVRLFVCLLRKIILDKMQNVCTIVYIETEKQLSPRKENPLCWKFLQRPICWKRSPTNSPCRMWRNPICSVKFIPTVPFPRWPSTTDGFPCPCPKRSGSPIPPSGILPHTKHLNVQIQKLHILNYYLVRTMYCL